MSHNITPAMISRRIAWEYEADRALVVEDLLARGATLTAEGWPCTHTWPVDLQALVNVGLGRPTLRWETLFCPVCREEVWPRYTVHG